jgi:hypothetical protein
MNRRAFMAAVAAASACPSQIETPLPPPHTYEEFVCALFGLPPSTFSGISYGASFERQRDIFISTQLEPWLRRMDSVI